MLSIKNAKNEVNRREISTEDGRVIVTFISEKGSDNELGNCTAWVQSKELYEQHKIELEEEYKRFKEEF